VKLVFLWGLPGTGKLTIGKELSELTGWKLFHNHLTVDLVLSIFPFGSKEFVDLRERIWTGVMEAAAASGLGGMIFTFNPENSVRQEFVDAVPGLMRRSGGSVEFVEIVCDEKELARRMDTPERREFRKLVSAELFGELKAKGVFDSPRMPAAKLRIDSTMQTAKESAVQIAEGLGLPTV
jgi:hypothetical protein